MKECCKNYLNEQFGGDEAVVSEIYNEYARSAREKAVEAENALGDASYDALDKIAHTVKGNALAAGDAETADVGIALRNAAKLQNREAAEPLVAKLKELAATL